MTDAPSELPQQNTVASLQASLKTYSSAGLSATLKTARVGTLVLCLCAALTGAVALGLGVYAFSGNEAGLVIVAAVALPAVALPIYVARRATALLNAISKPTEVMAQAKDLATRLSDGPELSSLLGQLRSSNKSTSGGRITRVLRSGRLISAIIALAGPDAKRHPLLVALTPERLRFLWLATISALWWWLCAGIFAALVGLGLLVSLVV